MLLISSRLFIDAYVHAEANKHRRKYSGHFYLDTTYTVHMIREAFVNCCGWRDSHEKFVVKSLVCLLYVILETPLLADEWTHIYRYATQWMKNANYFLFKVILELTCCDKLRRFSGAVLIMTFHWNDLFGLPRMYNLWLGEVVTFVSSQ